MSEFRQKLHCQRNQRNEKALRGDADTEFCTRDYAVDTCAKFHLAPSRGFLKSFIFRHVTIIGIKLRTCIPNLIEMAEIIATLCNHFQNGGHPAS